ncbi:MAG: SHD1 domain-containing protein [Pirellulales bacterium]
MNRIQFSHKLVASIAFSVILITTSLSAQNVVRTWTDKTGSFQIEAELLKYQDGKVHLLKKDGKLITVEVNILSNIDKGFLEGMSSKPANPFAGGTDAPMGVPMENTAGGGDLSLIKAAKTNVLKTNGRNVSLDFDKQLPPIEPDVFTSIGVRDFNVPLGKVDFFAKVTHPVLIDPKQSLFAFSVYHHGFGGADVDGRLYLIKGNGGSPQELMNLDVPLKMLDHHPASDRSLILLDFEDHFGVGGDLVLLDKTSTGKPTAIRRWNYLKQKEAEKRVP